MGRTYNVSEDYLVDKGLPIDIFGNKIKDEKCRDIFLNRVNSMTWKYQICNETALKEPGGLTGKKGFTVFEVILKEEMDPELMTEIIASFIPRRMVLAFFAEDRMSMASYIPGEYGLPPSVQVTKYYDYNTTQKIEIMNYELDSHKDYQAIQRRIINTLREKKKEILINQAFDKLKNEKKTYINDFDILFSQANLDKIREDAEFVEEQLRVSI